jgi:uncharacterized protein YkwD
MFDLKRMRRALLCCAVSLYGCQAQDGADPSAQQIGEAASLPELTPVEDDLEIGETSQSLVAELLCKSCTTSAECGGGANYCLKRGDGTRFCGGDCRRSACPSGFSCKRLTFSVYQCLPKQGECPRVAADAGSSGDASAAQDAGADAGLAQDASADAAAPVDAGSSPDATVSSDAGTPVPDASAPASDGGVNTHCAATASWDPSWVAFEDEVQRLSNLQRQAGAVCGETSYPPVAPLSADPALRCAARLHAKDLQDRDYFSHTTPDGVTFDQRITQAGYRWRTLGENIAAGYRTPQTVVQGWMQSPGHCQNIMNATFTQVGVGFYDDFRWTQDFGKPF